MEKYKVYVMTDEQGRITAIDSTAFLTDTEGWILIDQGSGERYQHAQGNYLDKQVFDQRGVYRYALLSGIPTERTQEDMDSDIVAEDNVDEIAELNAKVAELSAQNEILMEQNDLVIGSLFELIEDMYSL